jgi:type IV secretory pathway VirB2 component (pilin)
MKKLPHKIMKSRICLLMLFAFPSLALADEGQDKLSSVLSGLIGILTSTPARLMFVVAIIGVGYGTLAIGRIPKEKSIAIVIGVGIVFSASYIAKKLGLSA